MLKTILGSVALGCCILLGSACQGFAADYEHTIDEKDMTFSWKVDGDNLAVKLTAKTEGWVGIGFNPSDKMKDANYILGYVKDDKVEIVDDFGATPTSHKSDKSLDGTEDVTLVGGSEENDVTTLEFVIPLKSDDKNDGNIEVNGDTVVLLAYGAGRDSLKSKHKYRTTLTVNLSTGEVK